MSKDEVLKILYRNHPAWLIMAERMLPKYRISTEEDVVQDMYIKIYEKLREKKLKFTDIIIGDKPHYGIVYTTLHDIVVNIHRTEPKSMPIKNDIKIEEKESDALFYQSIDDVVNDFQWFHKKMFKLYSRKFQSIRKLSEATKISYKVVWKTVKGCKEEIKRKING
tara:strand:- start:11 stop:508 length:498 start_codon:yes stop_codon:yes gene_type:complete